MKIAIVVNGKPMDADDTHVIADVLRDLGIASDGDGVALALNEAVVPKRDWSRHPVHDGDVIEIIRAVQGG